MVVFTFTSEMIRPNEPNPPLNPLPLDHPLSTGLHRYNNLNKEESLIPDDFILAWNIVRNPNASSW